jgi:hypothetical protein
MAAALDPMMAEEADPTMVETETASEEVSGRLPVEKFVTQIYIHGLPLDKAAQFGEKAIEPLLQILSDPSMVRYHENAALTLGIIGSEKALAPLMAYVGQGPSGGEVAMATEDAARAAYKGRVGAVMGLGYLANLAGSEEAVEFLIRHSSPPAWSEGMLETLPPRRSAARDPRESLSKYAIIALGFSGSDNAVAHLRTLMSEGTRTGASGFIAEQADVIANSLQIFEDVSEGGLIEYYAQPN